MASHRVSRAVHRALPPALIADQPALPGVGGKARETLVLNADYQPLSVCPLSLWSWEDALRAVLAERVSVVATYDAVARAPSISLRVPSVVALHEYQDLTRRPPAFTRLNLFLRDGFHCAYCGGAFAARDLTFDHVVPRARGGGSSWENVVAACARCNGIKAARTPKEAGLVLRHKPYRPTRAQLNAAGRRFPPKRLERSWMDFLYWETALTD